MKKLPFCSIATATLDCHCKETLLSTACCIAEELHEMADDSEGEDIGVVRHDDFSLGSSKNLRSDVSRSAAFFVK